MEERGEGRRVGGGRRGGRGEGGGEGEGGNSRGLRSAARQSLRDSGSEREGERGSGRGGGREERDDGGDRRGGEGGGVGRERGVGRRGCGRAGTGGERGGGGGLPGSFATIWLLSCVSRGRGEGGERAPTRLAEEGGQHRVHHLYFGWLEKLEVQHDLSTIKSCDGYPFIEVVRVRDIYE